MKTVWLLVCLVICSADLFAQNPPFYNDIQHFKKQDSAHFPAKKSILFIGSSSFTKWTDVQDYFPGYPILNRGFGGSTLLDLIRYADDIIVPYKPKQIVIYCGENDIASSDTITAQTVVQRFITLFKIIRKTYPKVSVSFISMKPSPSREKFLPKMQAANQQIELYIATQKKADYINVYPYMLHEDGSPRKALFVEDMLHMNKNGYVIWQYVILPYLKK
jgi:lysophospholipase L1-like esterase